MINSPFQGVKPSTSTFSRLKQYNVSVMSYPKTLRILVTAVGGGVGQAVVKSLRMSGLACRILGTDTEPYSAGFAFCDTAYIVPCAAHREYIPRMLEICSQEKVDYVIPGSDPELLALSKAKPDLERYSGCRVVIADASCISICRDKLMTYQFFKARGLPFAVTVPFASVGDLIDERGFPIIAKPIDGSSSSGARVFFSHEEIFSLKNPERYVFQEYLVPIQWGKDNLAWDDVYTLGEMRQEHEISVQVLQGASGEILGVFMSENVLKKGIPMRVEPRDFADIRDVALGITEAFQATGLFGPLNIQGKITKRGFTVFEVNPRFTGITAVRAALGFRECEAIIRYLEGESLETIRSLLSVDLTKVALRFVDDVVIDRAFIESLVTLQRGIA